VAELQQRLREREADVPRCPDDGHLLAHRPTVTGLDSAIPLDPQLKLLLDHLAAAGGPPLDALSVEEARQTATLARVVEALGVPAPAPEVARVEERQVPLGAGNVAVRIYWPERTSGEPAPLLVWFHGGGFVLGSLDSSDPTARRLCAGAEAIVASVDYPLAPEQAFPAAVEACYAATRWLAEHAGDLGADPSRLAVGGDSAGGNLAAVTAQLARDRGAPPLTFQLLVYPIIDMFARHASMDENGHGYFLTAAGMEWFKDHYLPAGVDRRDHAVSPIYADELAGLPPALVVTAELDPLRDEGEAYAEALRTAGVEVTTRRYDGLIHGFFGMASVSDRADEAVTETIEALRRSL
jgi:acetyl esterase/lipase